MTYLAWYLAVAATVAFGGVCECLSEHDQTFWEAVANIAVVSLAWPLVATAAPLLVLAILTEAAGERVMRCLHRRRRGQS